MGEISFFRSVQKFLPEIFCAIRAISCSSSRRLTFFFWREGPVPVYCMSGSVRMLMRIPEIFSCVPSVYPKRFFCVSAVYPKDCGSRNGTKGPKFLGCRIFPHPKSPPPPQPWAVFAATRPSHACQKACTHLVCRPQRDPLMVCVRIPFGFWFPNGVFSRWLGHHVHEFQPKRPGIHGPPMRGAQW